MRLIDAHALYDQFLKEMEALVKSTNHEDIDLAAISMLCGSKMITDAPTVTPEPGWISVKDRMPKIGTVVLAFGTRSATTGTFQGALPNRPDVWMWKHHTPKHVSHWMPLPEPPKEET